MKSFMKPVKICNDVLLETETVVMGIITAFLVFCIFIEVVCRYLLFISVPWAEEISRYLFIWLTYIGSAYAVYYGQHTEIDVLAQAFGKAKEPVRGHGLKFIRYAAIMSTFCFQVIFAKVFWDYMMTVFSSAQTSPTMHIPMGLVYLPVFMGTVMAAIHCVYMFMVEMSESGDSVRQMEDAGSSDNQ